jgi:hypothetical protein
MDCAGTIANLRQRAFIIKIALRQLGLEKEDFLNWI